MWTGEILTDLAFAVAFIAFISTAVFAIVGLVGLATGYITLRAYLVVIAVLLAFCAIWSFLFAPNGGRFA